MSVDSGGPLIEWDLQDRLQKSLRIAGMSKQDMADYLDVHRNTIAAWLHGRITPGTQSLRLWAIRTNVPYEWLKEGQPGGLPVSFYPELALTG